MVRIVQQYKMGFIAILEGSLEDWVHNSTQANKAQTEFDRLQASLKSSKTSFIKLTQKIKGLQASA